MNNNTSGSNTNNMSSSAKTAAKRVAKKTEAVAVTVAVSAPAVAAAPAKKTKAAAAPVVAAAPAAPVAAAPEAQAVAAAAAPAVSVNEEIASLTSQLNTVKETLRKALVALKSIEKRHGQELKEARKRQRRRVKKETVDGEEKPARPSVFTTPILLKDGLATFLGKPKGTRMSPADVTRAVKVYIDEHKLKGDKHDINPDARMCEVLGVKAGETLTYKNIQKYLYQQYVKEAKPTA